MAAWVPFFQTLLWVLLIGGALWKYSTQVEDVLEAIRDRVRRGATVRIGPFEIGESPPAQSESVQQREMLEEVREATTTTTTPAPETSSPQIRTDAFLAEDLAIRELQLEFGVSINRQVALGRDANVDGMFAKGGRGYVVEMKYLRRAIPRDIVQAAIGQLRRYASHMGWRNVSVILAIVVDDDSIDLDTERSRVQRIAGECDLEVLVRVFSYMNLKRKYGFEHGG